MNWQKSIKIVRQHVVKIRTPRGYGTGFLCAYNASKNMAAIATALHVVESADEWGEPIKIIQETEATPVDVPSDERVVFTDSKRDSAAIMVYTDNFKLPETPLPMFDKSKYKYPGAVVGWLGYPVMASNSLCFFHGHTSAFNFDDDSYLVDGVAINGVSGGPVFEIDDPPRLIGIVSAYYANRRPGEVLPGLLMAHDLTHIHDTIARLRSIDEARAAKAVQEGEKDSVADTPATPTSPPNPGERDGNEGRGNPAGSE